ncbi:MAG TPA: DUF4345 domain-containing protein [Candidatus Limnocylindrales bacterium]
MTTERAGSPERTARAPRHVRLTDRVILAVTGLTGIVIGVAGTASTRAFYAANGVDLGHSPAALSDARAAAGAVLATGLLVALGAVVTRLTSLAAATGAAVLLGYGLARLLSIALDGLPGTPLIVATGVELALGAACLIVLARSRI